MSSTAPTTSGGRRPGLAGFQKLGRSLMLPIAALPAAALLLRIGQDDILGKDGLGWTQVAAVIGAAGNALFAHLPLLFAVGVAIGWAKKSDGSTALAAVVGYLVFDGVSEAMSTLVLTQPTDPAAKPNLINWGVLGGIVAGIVAAMLWQRFHRTKLPDALNFFGGRRLVPIITSAVMTLVAVAMAFVYPGFDWVLHHVSEWVASNGTLGGFVYGTLNRLLIPLGLHHILNSVPWFILGEYKDPSGAVWHGDFARFLHGDPTAGAFMTGFFPIMMFALPAAGIAMWQEARPEQKKVVGGVMLSTGLTAFLTGVTEPLEFAFMFIAWPLYCIHAVLTGTSMALCNALGIRDGFGFSAGAFDFFLNLGKADKPWLLVPIGLGYALVYYVLFRFVIRRWNLRTPGRGDDAEQATEGLVDTGR